MKTKYKFSFSKPYFKLKWNKRCDENTPPGAIDEQSHDTEKVDPPSLTGKQIVTEEMTNNYAITNLPNEIIEIILVDAVRSFQNSIETNVIFSQTCSRFKNVILKQKKDAILPHILMKFPDSVFDSLASFTR